MKARQLGNAAASMRVHTFLRHRAIAPLQYPVAVIAHRHNLEPASRWLCAALVCMPLWGAAQKVSISDTAVPALVDDAVRYQLANMHHTGWALRYRVHRVDSKEDTVRDLIESKDGNVARTLVRQGKSLTPDEDAAEQQRLRMMTPSEAAKHHRGAEASEKYGTDLIGALPRAMTYSLVPDQPQLPQFSVPQIVLDYAPRPGFQPASTAESLLTGLAGRMWIDGETHHLLRIEISIIRNLNLALGLLVRVYQGGTMVYEQHPVAGGHDAYTHIAINVTLRQLLVKTVPYRSTLDATDTVVLPAVPTLPEAVNLLLNEGQEKRP